MDLGQPDDLEKEGHGRRAHSSQSPNLPGSYSNQDSVVLAGGKRVSLRIPHHDLPATFASQPQLYPAHVYENQSLVVGITHQCASPSPLFNFFAFAFLASPRCPSGDSV